MHWLAATGNRLLLTAVSSGLEAGLLEYAVVARTFPDSKDSIEDIRRLFAQLTGGAVHGGVNGECHPPCDVVERPDAIEVTMDLPGVPAEAITVAFTRGALVIAGRKLAGGCAHAEAAFHLAERTFGSFTRVVRPPGAWDAGRSRASLRSGVLTVTIPRIDERRGREIRIPVETN